MTLTELDLDGVLARRPEVVVIDELAHTNAPAPGTPSTARTSRSCSPPGSAVPVRLTPTEWALLSELARNPGRLVGQRELLQAVWGPAYERGANTPSPAWAAASSRTSHGP